MLRAFWTLSKVIIFVLLLGFIAGQNGQLEIQWRDYTIEADLGLALLALTLVIIALLYSHSLFLRVTALPKNIRHILRNRAYRRSHEALTRSLVLMASGDAKHAAYQAYRAQKLLPDGMSSAPAAYIEAQMAGKMGQEERAKLAYKRLLDDKEGGFLGMKGLMQAEIDKGNYLPALQMAYQVRASYPKQPWVLKAIYDLEIRNHLWHKALQTGEKLAKKKGAHQAGLSQDQAAIYTVLGAASLKDGQYEDAEKSLKKALKANPFFLPALLNEADLYAATQKNKALEKLIRTSWAHHPHKELAAYWGRIAPINTPKKPDARLKWFEKLVALDPDAVEGQIAAARAALEDGLWAQARDYLSRAEELQPQREIYQLWSELEHLSTRDAEAAQLWMRKAATAPVGPTWVCILTGETSETWKPFLYEDGPFNTLQWAWPGTTKNKAHGALKAFTNDLLLLGE
ncbi:MAG: heme biosynthesis HemY N-terminal domain-containing protein [Pseudobdellovibrionaceae bacterium]